MIVINNNCRFSWYLLWKSVHLVGGIWNHPIQLSFMYPVCFGSFAAWSTTVNTVIVYKLQIDSCNTQQNVFLNMYYIEL